MHDLDRALQEYEADEGTFGSYEFAQEAEAEGDYEAESDEAESNYEAEGDYETESYAGEHESDGEYQFEEEAGVEGESDSEAVFDELEEMEQAASLLEVQDEEELDHFLGGLIAKAKKKLGSYLPPGVQKALAGALKKVARTALPKVGAAVGNLVVPGLGGVVGAGVASNAGKMFGLELEGMSYEDQQFEVARRIVGLSAQATKTAAQGSSAAPPPQAAKDAVLQAATTHAPGLATGSAAPRHSGTGPTGRPGRGPRLRSGRWFRRGHRIILVGA
jgi:hypothetical protein